MTNNQNPSPDASDHAAIAQVWFLLLAVIIVVEIGFLPVTRTLFAAVLPSAAMAQLAQSWHIHSERPLQKFLCRLPD